MSAFFHMGGYAAFIWPAWMVGLVILGGITFISYRRYRRAIAVLATLADGGDEEHG